MNFYEKEYPVSPNGQSYEKNQLGLSAMFLNSLRLTWTIGIAGRHGGAVARLGTAESPVHRVAAPGNVAATTAADRQEEK